MSVRKSIQINIPNPCNQNWDEMTPDANGRHCSLCQTSVIDFTTWTDAELFNFFSTRKTEVCGRLLSTQLNRPISIPYQPHSRLYRAAIVFGFTLLFTQPLQTRAQNYSPKFEQNILTQSKDTSIEQYGILSGRIIDEKKEPMVTAVIQLFQNNKLISGAVTDYDGYYKIDKLLPGDYEALVLYVGYDSISSKLTITKDNRTVMNQNLIRDKNQPETITIHCYGRIPLFDMDNPTKRTFTGREIRSMPY